MTKSERDFKKKVRAADEAADALHTLSLVQVIRGQLAGLRREPSLKLSRQAWTIAQELRQRAEKLDKAIEELVAHCETQS